ncbi:leucyl/phenylalanyl-tRNA--protein transferase [Alphaproteobacteria bacterium]|nr:leucyl/phenylalanyl-tRNA--protein transferase [Alphaproteobacteria bacterium]
MSKIIPVSNLLDFYKKGLFPMADNADSEIINLHQPKKRFIIPINNFHVPKKLFKLFKRNTYAFKINTNFESVISKCQLANRKDNGTWINSIILDSYLNLHFEKRAHSVECYDQNQLIGGLYGVHIGGCFFGESMFSELSNISKFCLLYLVAILKKNSFSILDSQFYNEHLIQFGAFEIENKIYLKELTSSINDKRAFTFIENFQEVLSLLQPNSHKS